MTRIELRSALACAASGLALVALPAGAAAQPAFVPGEVVVGIEGEAPRVAELAAGTSVGEAIAELERDPAGRVRGAELDRARLAGTARPRHLGHARRLGGGPVELPRPARAGSGSREPGTG